MYLLIQSRHLEDDVQQAKSANLEMKDKVRGVTAVMENSLLELESVRSSRLASNQQVSGKFEVFADVII